MKRIFLPAVALFSAPALAGPAGNWLDIDYGRSDVELDPMLELEMSEEYAERLAGQLAGDDGMMMRVDYRREGFVDDYLHRDNERQFLSLSMGRVVPFAEGVTLSGEIGYARRQLTYGVAGDDTGDVMPGAPLTVAEHELKDDAPFLRIGFDGTAGAFTWGIEGEYFADDPPPFAWFEPWSELGGNLRVGWQFGDAWNLGARYTTSGDITATTLSLRWSP